MNKLSLSIIIPTYNEKENIENIILEIFDLDESFNILIIDDGSPDGTAKIVKELQKKYSKSLFLKERSGKLGLGTAYIEGFKKCLELKYDYIFQLDCDGSHNPDQLIDLYDELKSKRADIVIGSRYIKGITVINWPLSRLLLSYFANYYVKVVTGLKINDSTGGFNGYSFNALNSITKNKIFFKGYAFQIQLKFIGSKLGFKVKEIPIIFKDREIGDSKMSMNIPGEAFFGVIYMKVLSLFKKHRR